MTMTKEMTMEARHGSWVVHEWDEYPSHSVLAGQPRKTFVDMFDTQEEALEAYPQAAPSHPLMQPQVSLNHLPGEGDPDPEEWDGI